MNETIRPEERMECPECGRTVSQRWNFCPKCRCWLTKPVELEPGMKISLNAGERAPESSFHELQNTLIEGMHHHLRAVEEVHFALMAMIHSFGGSQKIKHTQDVAFYVKELFETADPEVVVHKLQTGKWIVFAARLKDSKNIFCMGRIS